MSTFEQEPTRGIQGTSHNSSLLLPSQWHLHLPTLKETGDDSFLPTTSEMASRTSIPGRGIQVNSGSIGMDFVGAYLLRKSISKWWASWTCSTAAPSQRLSVMLSSCHILMGRPVAKKFQEPCTQKETEQCEFVIRSPLWTKHLPHQSYQLPVSHFVTRS